MTPVRWSHLKFMARSPAHYRDALARDIKPTAAMRVGSYAHSLALGGPRRFAFYEARRAGKKWEAFKAEHEARGTEIVSVNEATQAEGCAESLTRHGHAMQLLGGVREQRVFWQIGKRSCMGTPDSAIPFGSVVELKVTADASPARFPWHARSSLWPAQLSWYANGLGLNGRPLWIVAVESRPPHVVQVYSLSEEMVKAAEAKWRGMFETLMVCEANDSWPGYCETYLPLEADEQFTLQMDGEEIDVG